MVVLTYGCPGLCNSQCGNRLVATTIPEEAVRPFAIPVKTYRPVRRMEAVIDGVHHDVEAISL
jgi:hypothetical protein